MCVESTRDDSRAHLGCTVATHGEYTRVRRGITLHTDKVVSAPISTARAKTRGLPRHATHENSREVKQRKIHSRNSQQKIHSRSFTVSFRDGRRGLTTDVSATRHTREETADALTPSAQWPRRETSRSRPIENTLEKRDTKREEHLSLKYGVWSSNMTVTTSRAWRYGSQRQPNTSGSAHREEEIGRAASWRRSSTAALRLQRLQRVR